jgi:hypothetical protein
MEEAFKSSSHLPRKGKKCKEEEEEEEEEECNGKLTLFWHTFFFQSLAQRGLGVSS